jgi:hypothetical protein
MSKTYTTLTWRERLDIYAARRAEFEARRRAWEITKQEEEYLDGFVVWPSQDTPLHASRTLCAVVEKNWR